MQSGVRSTKGFTLIEMIIALAIFAQLTVMVGSAVMLALKYNQFNKATRTVNMELYGIMVNGIGAYIRSGTGIMYQDPKVASRDGTRPPTEGDLDRSCKDQTTGAYLEDLPTDQLTIYQDRENKKWITFQVRRDAEAGTSRIVWHRHDADADEPDGNDFYLNSADTYITCFLVTPSPDPHVVTDPKSPARDLQPYVALHIAGRDKNSKQTEENMFPAQNTEIDYRTLYTLRNYNYSSP